MVCDWYQTTIHDAIQNVVPMLEDALNCHVVEAKTGMMGYDWRGFLNDDEGITRATLLYGSRNPNQNKPHAFATSESAQKFMDVMRNEWAGRHTVTRIDVAEDMYGQGLFEEIQAKMVQLSKKQRITTSVAGDWLSDDKRGGRTIYLGAPTSDVRARLYEKGKEVANKLFFSKGYAVPEGFPMDWVRLELQCRPTRLQREVAATIPLEQFWGFAKWSNRLAEDVFSMSVPRVAQIDWKKSRDEEVLKWVGKQYGKLFLRRLDKLGSWEAVGKELGLYVK